MTLLKRVLPAIVILSIVAAVPFIAADDDKFVGKPGPEFQVEKWLSDQPDLTGKYVVVDFWATWCGPCVRAIPHMNAMSQELGDQFAFVALSREDEATVRSFKKATIEYASAIDSQSRMARFFEIRTIPHVVVMDPQGTVIWKGHPGTLTADYLKSLTQS